MNELDVLYLFYDEMQAKGVTREALFLSIDNEAVAKLAQKSGATTPLEQVQKLTDICIANEWLERTSADPYYKYLSLTEAGLQIVIANKYTG